MQHGHKVLVKRQMPVTDTVTPTANGVAGGETITASVNPGSSLLLGASGSLTTNPGVTSTSSPTPKTSSSSSSNNSSPSLSTGSAVAITVAVFLVLVGAMILIYIYIKRRTALRARHPFSRVPPPAVRGAKVLRDHGKDKQRSNGDDRGEGKNNSPRGVLNSARISRAKSSFDSAKLGLFKNDPNSSGTDEKANISISDDHHFDPLTMASFAKYQVGPADDLSALPHPHPLATREDRSPVVSWDGRTVISDPFASLHASVSDTMSPTSVIVRQTPQTTDNAQHRWESAEVLMMDETTTEPMSVYSDASQDPFNDDSDSRRSPGDNDSDSRRHNNPFFNASQHNPFADRSTRSRASSVSTATAKRSRSYSASSSATVRAAVTRATTGESENALVSLLAALHPTHVVSDEVTNRGSIQTSVTSLYHPVEGEVDPGTPQAF